MVDYKTALFDQKFNNLVVPRLRLWDFLIEITNILLNMIYIF